jgi:hypothetical protein
MSSAATFPFRHDERFTVGASPTGSNVDAHGRELVGVRS